MEIKHEQQICKRKGISNQRSDMMPWLTLGKKKKKKKKKNGLFYTSLSPLPFPEQFNFFFF